MNCWLEDRKKRFENLFTKEELVNPHIAVIKPNEIDLRWLKKASMDYLASIVNYPEYRDEEDLLKEFQICHDIGYVKNITPTGMLLPKRNTSLHYNAFLKAFYKLVMNTEVGPKLKSCHTPAHLRVKWPMAVEQDLNRPRHAPEDLHFDSWSGYSSQSMTFLLGILGDVSGNRVRYFQPKESYDEDWLLNKPTPEFLLEHYEVIDYTPKYGEIVVLDTCVLHQTYRDSGCGIRFSIDNLFLSRDELAWPENIEKHRQDELTDPMILKDVGTECFYFCTDKDDERKDTKGGAIDPTNYDFYTRPKNITYRIYDE